MLKGYIALKRVNFGLYIILLFLLSACSAIRLTDDASVIRFESPVNASSVAEFIRIAQTSPKVKKIILNSNGGDLVAGMDMGDYILSRNLDVEVESKCFSSCANYLFISGNKKIIQDGALVGWHGSMTTKLSDASYICEKIEGCNYQEYIAEITAKYGKDEEYYLNGMNKILAPMIERQQQFYQVRGVVQQVTTYGHCHGRNKRVWTYSISDMRKFGIRNIIADEEKYLAAVATSELVDLFKYPVQQSALDCEK